MARLLLSENPEDSKTSRLGSRGVLLRARASEREEGFLMCGIVGYVGDKESAPILVSGLKKLEYRGYDSAGVAVVNRNQLNVVRATGKLKNLENRVSQE